MWVKNCSRRLKSTGVLSAHEDGDRVAGTRGEPVAIHRLKYPPHPVTLSTGSLTLYVVELSTPPSRAWRAALLRPPPTLTRLRRTPKLGRLGADGARLTFRTTPRDLHQWLRWIDRWIAYANSVVAE